MLRSTLLLLAISTIGFAQEDIQKENETVTVLNLSNQGITTLDDHDFTKYRDLEEIDLSNNDLQFIKENTFVSNTKLKKLNLSGNKNLKLPEFSTLLIANIEELDLSNCNIEELPPNIFDGLTDLKILDLSGNPLIEESIKESTISNLMSPQKLILPYVDEEMIKKICHEVDIMIEIKSEDHTTSIPCKDVREGTWQNIPKESDDNQDTETDNHKDEELEITAAVINDEKTENNDETQPEETNTEPQPLQTDTHEQPDNAELNTESTHHHETENNDNEEIKTENTDAEAGNTESNNTETKTKNVEDSNNVQLNLENTENNENVHNELHAEPSTEIPEPQSIDPQIDAKSNVDVANSNILPIETSAPSDDTKLNENVPDAVDGILKQNQTESTDSVIQSSVNNQEEQKNSGNQDNKEKPPPLQRGVLNVPSQPVTAEQNLSEKMQKLDNIEDRSKATTTEESSGAGSSILVILVIAVVVAGAVAFGYKFYKTRRYQATRTAEPMERELKEIVVDKKPNGTSKAGDTIEEREEEPLMEKRENSVEIKEIDDSYDVKAPKNETAVINDSTTSNPPTSSPYVPTTTPIKPPHQTSNNKDDDKTQI